MLLMVFLDKISIFTLTNKKLVSNLDQFRSYLSCKHVFKLSYMEITPFREDTIFLRKVFPLLWDLHSLYLNQICSLLNIYMYIKSGDNRIEIKTFMKSIKF